MVRTLVSRASQTGVARLSCSPKRMEPPMDGLLFVDDWAGPPVMACATPGPSRSSSSSAAGGPQVPAP